MEQINIIFMLHFTKKRNFINAQMYKKKFLIITYKKDNLAIKKQFIIKTSAFQKHLR